MFFTHSPAKMRIRSSSNDKIEAAAAGIALPAATAAQLQVDAAGFVPLGADDVQAPHLFDFATVGLHLLALLDLVDQGVPFRVAARRGGSDICPGAGPRPSSPDCRRG